MDCRDVDGEGLFNFCCDHTGPLVNASQRHIGDDRNGERARNRVLVCWSLDGHDG